MSDTFTDLDTPFRKFKARSARQCNGCRGRIHAGSHAWKPEKENRGSWMPSAVLCATCGDKKLGEASRVEPS